MSIKGIVALSVMTAALLAGSAEARQTYARGCDSGDQTASTVVGAVIGGVIGGQFGNGGDDRAIGAVAGALLGGAAGNRLAAANCDQSYSGGYDQQPHANGYDQTYQPRYAPRDDGNEEYVGAQYGGYDESPYYDNAFETAAPDQRVRWDDPDSGNYGYVQPANWYQDDSGNDCREFEQTIYIDGRAQRASGTACREPDGSWRIVE